MKSVTTQNEIQPPQDGSKKRTGLSLLILSFALVTVSLNIMVPSRLSFSTMFPLHGPFSYEWRLFSKDEVRIVRTEEQHNSNYDLSYALTVMVLSLVPGVFVMMLQWVSLKLHLRN
mmetsp:Transcript_19709/g.29021  ORF Transcript_19709/g.29021 Transcript_19709/m.29021 type:complete len:116 (+) Transcript_19709:207-554(+)